MAGNNTIPMAQRSALFRIRQNQNALFGVIIEPKTAGALLRRGLAELADRRQFARITGTCLRLTDAGQAYINTIEREPRI